MLIAILGVIVLIVGIVLKRSPEPGSHFGSIVTTVGVVIVILGLL
ncbi:MAG: prohibitin family protein, partial [Mucilaginibacter sp.]|nr:prohibitin family protein [Mucilaginibacter sp.]